MNALSAPTMHDYAAFNIWLKRMQQQVLKVAKDPNATTIWPIYGKFRKACRKVWFWPDGEYLIINLDADGCVTGDQKELEMELVKPSERHAMTTPKSTLPRRQVALAELKRLQAELAALARFPDDDFPEHTVLMTTKTYRRPMPAGISTSGAPFFDMDSPNFAEQMYTYVLIKANDQWWMTGQNGHQINGASWDKVVEFVDDGELIDVRTGRSVMTDATQPAPPNETISDAIGDEAAAKVTKFLDDPSTGTERTRPTRDES